MIFACHVGYSIHRRSHLLLFFFSFSFLFSFFHGGPHTPDFSLFSLLLLMLKSNCSGILYDVDGDTKYEAIRMYRKALSRNFLLCKTVDYFALNVICRFSEKKNCFIELCPKYYHHRITQRKNCLNKFSLVVTNTE